MSKNSKSNIGAFRLPKKQDILAYISENPGSNGKRELAKAFNLKGDARIWLKDILRELADEGAIEKRSKTLLPKGALPTISAAIIYDRDRDGDFLARPLEWDNDAKSPIIIIPAKRHGKEPVVGVNERVLVKVFPNKHGGIGDYVGRIVRKIIETNKTILGVLTRSEDGKWGVSPIDRRDGVVRLDTPNDFTGNAGDLVEVSISKNNKLGIKSGVIHEVLGHVGSEKSLSKIAIISHEIPHIFPQNVLDEAERAKAADWSKREDWRDIPFVTIDPADAKDHDDAVYAIADSDESNKGGYIIYVAIADVAYYVRPESPLDNEALKRGNSVYFPDRVVPMLPERISNDLCSLRENEERPALAAKMTFDSKGHKIKHSFHRVMICSHAKLAYAQAQAAIDGMVDEKTAPILETILKPLWAAYSTLKIARAKREPLDLDLPERKILLDEQGRIKDVIVPERLDAHRLVEEFMISANVAAAEIVGKKRFPLIYRIHDKPSLAKQETLREFLLTLNMPLARGADLTPAKFNQILSKVKDTDKQDMVNQVVLRTQSQAEYNTDNIGHFGLHLRHYAHFTSPIRRYADLTVHRVLIEALDLGVGGHIEMDMDKLDLIATSISSTERRAMAAERETVDRLVAHYLADRIGATFTGRINGTAKAGVFITLDKLGADGFVPVASLGKEYFNFDEARHAFVGERSRKGYQLGDTVEVRLVEAQPIAGALRFDMITPPHDLPFSPVSHHKSKRNRVSSSFKKRRR